MLNLEIKTALKGEDVIDRLKGFFGPGGLGLEVAEESAQCLSFTGGGGYVTATLCPQKNKTRIDLVTREWDYQVKQFAARVG